MTQAPEWYRRMWDDEPSKYEPTAAQRRAHKPQPAPFVPLPIRVVSHASVHELHAHGVVRVTGSAVMGV